MYTIEYLKNIKKKLERKYLSNLKLYIDDFSEDLLILINQYRENVFANYVNINKIIHQAIELNNLEVLYYIVENGADVNLLNYDGNTPLLMAIEQQNLEIIQYLVENGADVNLENGDRYTPLLMAIEQQNLEIIQYLVENGADVNLEYSDGYSPILLATMIDNEEIIDYLMTYY
jgi:ankyrin repeat protein